MPTLLGADLDRVPIAARVICSAGVVPLLAFTRDVFRRERGSDAPPRELC